MARNSFGQKMGKLLEVAALVSQGKTNAVACKEAKVTPASLKKWEAELKGLPRPRRVVSIAEPFRTLIAFGAGGDQLLRVEPGASGLSMVLTGVREGSEHSRVALRTQESEVQAVAAGLSADAREALVLLSDGSLHRWTPGSEQTSACPHDLKARKSDLEGCSTTLILKWRFAAISPDLSLIAYWEKTGGKASWGDNCDLVLWQVADGKERARLAFPDCQRGQLVFSPDGSLLATYETNKLITTVDTRKGKVVLAKGPQVHSVSFTGPGTLMCDDWYGKTIEVDLATQRKTELSTGWGSQGSLGDRYAQAKDGLIILRSKKRPKAVLELPVGRFEEFSLATTGDALAVVADVLIVWDLR